MVDTRGSESRSLKELRSPWFPRTARYDPQWVIDNSMGPNPLWLAESLSTVLTFTPGMRVLDLGCGRAVTSIFLAKEFDVTVWAGELWMQPTGNWRRVRDAGMSERVYPMTVEAHTLPFPEGFFDAIVSFDAYHYFGTDDLYLDYLVRFLRPGGRLGIVSPGLTVEIDGEVPAHLRPCWDPAYRSFHSPQWWRRHWVKSGVVDVEVADMVPDGWRHWLLWCEGCSLPEDPTLQETARNEAELVRRDQGEALGFVRVLAAAREVE